VTPDSGPPAAGPLPVKLPVKQLLLVLGVVATAYAAALLIWGDSPRASLARLWSWTGLQAGALCLLNYLLRGMRWRLWMAHYGRHFGWLQGLRLYLAGYAFTPTPGNVGEAVRGLMLARKPLGAVQSLAIFGAERLADLLCLLLLCLPAVGWALGHGAVQTAPPWLLGLVATALLVATLVLSVIIRYRRALLQRFTWLQDAWHCLAVRPLAWFALTLAAWAAQGIAVWLICRDMEVPLDLLTATGFYAVAMVAGALSALPAGLGGTEAVLTGLLVAQSATPGQALTITVLTRLLTLWLAVAIGVATLLYSAAIRKEISFR
jgi:uncharacterized membrane protein YbhN (UPF0104 family)